MHLRRACAVALLALVTACSPDSQPDARRGWPANAPLAAADAERLSSDLTSGEPRRIARSLEMPPGQRLDRQLVEGLQSVESLDVDVRTFERLAADEATVLATMVDGLGRESRWRLHLHRSEQRWLISGTEELPT